MTDVRSAALQERLEEGASCPSPTVSVKASLNKEVSTGVETLRVAACLWVLAVDDSPLRLYAPEIRKPKSEYKVTRKSLATL